MGYIQIKNIKDKNHCIQFFTYIKCSKKFDKDNLYDYIKNNNVIFNIKYRLLFRNNYIYDEFEEHYDVKSSIIDKINKKMGVEESFESNDTKPKINYPRKCKHKQKFIRIPLLYLYSKTLQAK